MNGSEFLALYGDDIPPWLHDKLRDAFPTISKSVVRRLAAAPATPLPTVEEVARVIDPDTFRLIEHYDSLDVEGDTLEAYPDLKTARDEARAKAATILTLFRSATPVDRNAVLEEAAKIADGWVTLFGEREIHFTSAREHATDAAKDIADNIRALKSQPLTKRGD